MRKREYNETSKNIWMSLWDVGKPHNKRGKFTSACMYIKRNMYTCVVSSESIFYLSFSRMQ